MGAIYDTVWNLSMPTPGYVYILLNPSMPKFLKIGKTTKSPEVRASEISAPTGIPTPFHVAFEAQVADCDAAEAKVHKELEQYRVTNDREFFAAPLKHAIVVLETVAKEQRYTGPVSHASTGTANSQNVGVEHHAKPTYSIEERIFAKPEDPAQKRLGYALEGRKCKEERRNSEARQFFEKAVESGDVSVCFELGKMCELGIGGGVDLVRAYTYYIIARSSGSSEVVQSLAACEQILPEWTRKEARSIARKISPNLFEE